MSTETADPGHGHSPAAWTAVTIMLIAITVGTVAFFLDVQWLVWASAVVLVIGLVVGWVLARAGYGVGGAKVTPKAH
ncbi:DUF6704 family protein [Agromyces bauzanensis]